MKYPEIPTDNLYKFMTIIGLIIIGLSFIPMLYTGNVYLKNVSTLAAMEAEFSMKSEILDSHTEELKKTEEFANQIKEQGLALIELETFRTRHNAYSDTVFKIGSHLTYFLWYLGLSLLLSGFFLWYIKLQKYNDIMLLMKVTSDPEYKEIKNKTMFNKIWRLINKISQKK